MWKRVGKRIPPYGTTTIPDTVPRPRIWQQPDFLKFWLADLISQLGTQITFLGLPLIAVVTLGASPVAVSMLQTVEWLPVLLISLPSGAWVDRLRRLPILIVSDLLRAGALLLILLAFLTDALSMWLLYVVAFVTGTLAILFDVAHRSYLPSLLDRNELMAGNSALEVSGSAVRVAGPGLAGGLITLLTAPWAIVVDAVSFVCSAVLLKRIRQPEPPPQPPVRMDGHASRLHEEIGEGLRYVVGHRLLVFLISNGALANLGAAMIEGVLVVYVVRELGLSAAQIGAVFTAANVGLLIGAPLAVPAMRRFGIGPVLIASTMLQGSGLVLVPLASLAPLPLLVAGQMLRAFGIVVYNVNQRSLRQAIVPVRLQGRVNATGRFIGWGTIPLGTLLGGSLATVAGFGTALWMGAIIGLLAVLPLIFSPVHALRHLPEPEES